MEKEVELGGRRGGKVCCFLVGVEGFFYFIFIKEGNFASIFQNQISDLLLNAKKG